MKKPEHITIRREHLADIYFLLKEIKDAQSQRQGHIPSVPVSKTDVDRNVERVSNLLGFPPEQEKRNE